MNIIGISLFERMFNVNNKKLEKYVILFKDKVSFVMKNCIYIEIILVILLKNKVKVVYFQKNYISKIKENHLIIAS